MEVEVVTSTWRKVKNNGFTGLAGLAVLAAIIPLVSVTYYVIAKGAPVVSVAFLTNLPTTPTDPLSGVAPALLGTLIMTLTGAAIGVPLGVLAGAWLSEFGRNKYGYTFRLAMDAMAATPSIVMGLVVFSIVVLSQNHYSALAGSLALAAMIVPVVVRTTEVALTAVPDTLREAGVALGSTNTRTLFTVILPAGRRGMLTGIILAVARVAGETAPLLFTAGYAQYWIKGLNDPTAALPTLIYNYIDQPYEQLQAQAWGAAFLLFVLVFGANVIVRVFTRARSGNP